MINLQFISWGRFLAKRDRAVTTRWLARIKNNSERAFRNGMLLGAKSGRIYRRRGEVHQASAPGEFPAKDTGNLLASLKGQSTATEATVGTNMPYSKFLRTGTKKMARRKMSDDALKQGRAAEGSPRGWVAWAKGK